MYSLSSTQNEISYKKSYSPIIPSPLVTNVKNSGAYPKSRYNKFDKSDSNEFLKLIFLKSKPKKIEALVEQFEKEVAEGSGGAAHVDRELIIQTLQTKLDPEKVLASYKKLLLTPYSKTNK